jgi:hypothetical protein
MQVVLSGLLLLISLVQVLLSGFFLLLCSVQVFSFFFMEIRALSRFSAILIAGVAPLGRCLPDDVLTLDRRGRFK